jgi:hypothetical protein
MRSPILEIEMKMAVNCLSYNERILEAQGTYMNWTDSSKAKEQQLELYIENLRKKQVRSYDIMRQVWCAIQESESLASGVNTVLGNATEQRMMLALRSQILVKKSLNDAESEFFSCVNTERDSLKGRLAELEDMESKSLDTLKEAVLAHREYVNPAFSSKPKPKTKSLWSEITSLFSSESNETPLVKKDS